MESIEQRKLERSLLVAETLRRGVEFERDDREAKRVLGQALEALEEDVRKKVLALNEVYEQGVNARSTQLLVLRSTIEKLDGTLESMRKNLGAEIAKVDADLGRKEA